MEIFRSPPFPVAALLIASIHWFDQSGSTNLVRPNDISFNMHIPLAFFACTAGSIRDESVGHTHALCQRMRCQSDQWLADSPA
jgi:hypothetical protein